MPELTDERFLRTEQYRDASNLQARISVHQRFSTNACEWQRWVFDHLDLPERCDILDVGCGPGDLWAENVQRIPAGWSIVMSDLSPGMLEKGHHHPRDPRPHPATAVLDAQAIPFPDGVFDAVIANHMLYHLANLDRALCEMHRVLRSGGRLFAATNGRRHLRELQDLVASFCPEACTFDPAAEFGLENGEALLARHFGDVTLYRQDNALLVTEAEPLIAYARSMICETASTENLEALRHWLREQIASQGAVFIHKDSGMFRATRT